MISASPQVARARPAICWITEIMDGRDKPGHDDKVGAGGA